MYKSTKYGFILVKIIKYKEDKLKKCVLRYNKYTKYSAHNNTILSSR